MGSPPRGRSQPMGWRAERGRAPVSKPGARRGRGSAVTTDGPGELDQTANDVRHAIEQIDRGRTQLFDPSRDLTDVEASAIGADHELAGEDVAVDDAGVYDGEQSL